MLLSGVVASCIWGASGLVIAWGVVEVVVFGGLLLSGGRVAAAACSGGVGLVSISASADRKKALRPGDTLGLGGVALRLGAALAVRVRLGLK